MWSLTLHALLPPQVHAVSFAGTFVFYAVEGSFKDSFEKTFQYCWVDGWVYLWGSVPPPPLPPPASLKPCTLSSGFGFMIVGNLSGFKLSRWGVGRKERTAFSVQFTRGNWKLDKNSESSGHVMWPLKAEAQVSAFSSRPCSHHLLNIKAESFIC